MSKRVAHKIKKKWRSEDVKLEEDIDFSALLLSERVLKGLKRSGFRKPSPIQMKSIPLGRFGADLIIQSKSGTGKTCVFAIVALEGLSNIPNLQVLILSPTREIAHQTCCVINSIGQAFPDLQCHMFIGGTFVADDITKLKSCQIAVGTPGRIKHLLEISALTTGCIRLLVLDEADKLVDNKFVVDINWIFNRLPLHKQVLTLSATFPEPLKELLTNYMRSPTLISVSENELALKGVTQYYRIVEHHPLSHIMFQQKKDAVWEIINGVSFSQCLIFCNYIGRVEMVYDWLCEEGYPVAKITSNDDQATRLDTMEQLKQFKCRLLVSSDLTARGIDAENVDLVINLDLSGDLETYLHRIGRAGRYGSKAISITIISMGYEEQKLSEYERSGNFKVFPLPDPLPHDLSTWSRERAAASKTTKCMQSIDELQSKSFKGSVWDENKDLSEQISDGNFSDSDNSSAETSGDVLDARRPGGNKSEEGNDNSLVAEDEPALENHLDGGNGQDVSGQLQSETLLENGHSMSTSSEQKTGEDLNNSRSEGGMRENTLSSHNPCSDDARCLVNSEINSVEDKSLGVELDVDELISNLRINSNTRAETASIGENFVVVQEDYDLCDVSSDVANQNEMHKADNVPDSGTSLLQGQGEKDNDKFLLDDNPKSATADNIYPNKEDIDVFLLSCCLDRDKCLENHKGCGNVNKGDISKLITPCFDPSNNKSKQNEKSFDAILEDFKSDRNTMAICPAVTSYALPVKDISAVEEYLHNSKKMYLSKIDKIAQNVVSSNPSAVVNAVLDVLNSSEVTHVDVEVGKNIVNTNKPCEQNDIPSKDFKDLNLGAEDSVHKVDGTSTGNGSISKRTNLQEREVPNRRSKGKARLFSKRTVKKNVSDNPQDFLKNCSVVLTNSTDNNEDLKPVATFNKTPVKKLHNIISNDNSSLHTLSALVQKPNAEGYAKVETLKSRNKSSSIQHLPMAGSGVRPKVECHDEVVSHERSGDYYTSEKCVKPRHSRRHHGARRHSMDHDNVFPDSSPKEYGGPTVQNNSRYSVGHQSSLLPDISQGFFLMPSLPSTQKSCLDAWFTDHWNQSAPERHFCSHCCKCYNSCCRSVNSCCIHECRSCCQHQTVRCSVPTYSSPQMIPHLHERGRVLHEQLLCLMKAQKSRSCH